MRQPLLTPSLPLSSSSTTSIFIDLQEHIRADQYPTASFTTTKPDAAYIHFPNTSPQDKTR